jgi:molybdopterin biosynthesis enzyme MoaB
MGDQGGVIRTGLLHVPQLAPETGEAVARLLVEALGRRVVVLREGYAAADRRWLEATLCEWCDEVELDLLLTLGGTLPAPGPSGREAVPEATLAVIERLVPGIPEAMRAGLRAEYPEVILDRGVAGIRGRTLIVNLPAGVGPATFFLEAVVAELPLILAHLRESPIARPLDHWLQMDTDAGEEAGAQERGAALTSGDAEGAPLERGKGLDAAEFAAFLRRKGEADPPA